MSKCLFVFDFDCTISIRCLGKFVRKPKDYSKYDSTSNIEKESLVNLFRSYEGALCEISITSKQYLEQNTREYNVQYYNNNKEDLQKYFIREIFGEERFNELKTFLVELKKIGNVILVSLNQKPYIDLCLEIVGLTDIFTSIYGEKEVFETLFYDAGERQGTKLDIILKEYVENGKSYKHIFFFDDSPDKNYKPVKDYFHITNEQNEYNFNYFDTKNSSYPFIFYNYNDLQKDCMSNNVYIENKAGIKSNEFNNIITAMREIINRKPIERLSSLNKYIKYKNKYLALKKLLIKY